MTTRCRVGPSTWRATGSPRSPSTTSAPNDAAVTPVLSRERHDDVGSDPAGGRLPTRRHPAPVRPPRYARTGREGRPLGRPLRRAGSSRPLLGTHLVPVPRLVRRAHRRRAGLDDRRQQDHRPVRPELPEAQRRHRARRARLAPPGHGTATRSAAGVAASGVRGARRLRPRRAPQRSTARGRDDHARRARLAQCHPELARTRRPGGRTCASTAQPRDVPRLAHGSQAAGARDPRRPRRHVHGWASPDARRLRRRRAARRTAVAPHRRRPGATASSSTATTAPPGSSSARVRSSS